MPNLSELVRRAAGGVLAVALAAVLTPVMAAAPAALTVSTVAPRAVDLTRRLAATGSIYAWQEIVIAPEVGGYQVAAVEVEIGDRVRRGQELARLAAELLQSQVEIESAGVQQAQATLATARAALRRGEAVSASGALSSADLETLRSNEISAQAGLSSAQANLDSAQLRLRFTHVTAPDDGIITARSVNIGQVVQAGTEIMRLLRKGRIEWRAEVPEADLALIQRGQKVNIITATGAALAGTVRSVAPTVQSNNRTGLIYVDIAETRNVRPGMFARGEIAVSRAPALMLPLASVAVLDGYSYVYVLRADQTVERRRVQTGVVQGTLIEVTQGVSANEQIVDRGAGFLTDGEKVNVAAAAT